MAWYIGYNNQPAMPQPFVKQDLKKTKWWELEFLMQICFGEKQKNKEQRSSFLKAFSGIFQLQRNLHKFTV